MLTEEEQQALNQLKETMDKWKANKKHRGDKIPEVIWNKIFEFLEKTTIPENEVLKIIGVKPEQINNKRKSLGLGKALTKNQLPSVQNDKTYKSTQTTQVEMCKPDGTIIKFQAPLSELLSILN